MQTLTLQSEALSKKETQAQGFSCEFCKIFKNIFLCRTALCFCNFNIAKVRLSMYCALLTNFRYLSKSLPNSINLVYRWKVTVKWKITFYFFSKKEEMKLKKMAMSFLLLYLKELQSGFLVTKIFPFFWLGIHNFCFEAKTISRTFIARLGTVGTFFMFIKRGSFSKKR